LDIALQIPRGWDDCVDAVLEVLTKCKDVEMAKRRAADLQVLVKAKKFEQTRQELGVIRSEPF
jgi:hypothetical protein